jgi:Predicted RNA-binding protein
LKQEIIATGRTVEAAIANGAEKLGVAVERLNYEVIDQPKKGFLGFGEAPAKVKIIYVPGPEDTAVDFVKTLFANMNINADVELSRERHPSGDRLIKITGEEAGVLIGHHGDTLDSLQCLVNLAANKSESDEEKDGNYIKITVDIENYRIKREDTLKRLARNMASKVQKYRKSITLEPMNPYERRIIHSEIQNIAGVSTTSIGTDNNRKVVIFLEEKGKPKRNGPRPQKPKPTEAKVEEPKEEETK